ncbi:MAG: hypothetical protein KDD70_10955, partial [Bdellovibrionales bacterium]|nr:hypothetical protein [Bdellovibrionales bacterium]
MKVRAYVGSAGYTDASISGYVNGLQAERSPGSLLKPFVYGLALDQGKIIPQSMLSDLPLRLASYRPENFERNFIGPISAEHALIRSRNIPALQVFRMLDDSSLYSLLRAADLSLEPEDYYGIALVLGGLGISTEQIAELYGLLGSSGTFTKLSYLEEQKERELKERPVKLLSPEAAYLVRDMLSRNPPALGRFRSRHIPWKTGTSYGSKDAWAAGIVGRFVVVVWLGDFRGASNPNLVGRDFAGPLFFSAADRMMSRGVIPETPMTPGLNLKKIEVCALSGALPGPACTHERESWFIPGVSPIEHCTLHQSVRVDPVSGERACPGEEGEERVFEVWPSEMQKLFTRVGLKRNTPPPYKKSCGLSVSASQKISILSPEEHLEYYLEEHRPLEISLVASVPGDADTVTWFANDEVIVHQQTLQPAHWTARAGTFTVRAVDNLGRSASVRVRVHSRAS